MRLLLTFPLAFSKNEMEIDLISSPDFAEPWPPLIQCAMSVADEIAFGSIISYIISTLININPGLTYLIKIHKTSYNQTNERKKCLAILVSFPGNWATPGKEDYELR